MHHFRVIKTISLKSAVWYSQLRCSEGFYCVGALFSLRLTPQKSSHGTSEARDTIQTTFPCHATSVPRVARPNVIVFVFSLSLSHTHTHKLSLSHTHTLSPPHTHKLSLAHTHTQTLSLTLSLSRSRTRVHGPKSESPCWQVHCQSAAEQGNNLAGLNDFCLSKTSPAKARIWP